MHENDVYHAIKGALRRKFPDMEKTPDGLKELDDLIMDIMNDIKEKGIAYKNVKGE
jgi:hypothetical protein